jgi:hypothetical protein
VTLSGLAVVAALTVAALTTGGRTAEGTTWHVAPGGSGGACSRPAPCGSFDVAYDRASPGDRVRLAAGSYGPQAITGDKRSTAPVVIEPAPDASVQVDGVLDVNADHVTVRRVGASDGYVVSNDEPANPIVGVRLQGVRGPTAYFQNVRDFTLKGGDLGGRPGVKVITIGAWPGSRGLTVDGLYLHDNPPASPEDHLECIFAVHVQGLTVRNSRFSNCGYFGILTGACCGGDQETRDLTLENNVFGPTRCYPGSFACPEGRAPYSVHLGTKTSSGGTNVIRNNLFLTPPAIETGALDSGRFTSNVGAHGTCAAGLTYGYNILARGSAMKCGRTDLHADIRGDYDERGRLTDPASPAVGFGDPMDSPRRDRFGRPRDSRPDAGPAEFDRPPTVELRGRRFARICRRKRTGCRRTTARLRLLLSEPANLTVTIERVVRHGDTRRVRRLRRWARLGSSQVRISARSLSTGRYRVTATAVDPAGNRSAPARFRLAVRP